MVNTSTIDLHAVNRAKLVERLAAGCLHCGFTASDIMDHATRSELIANLAVYGAPLRRDPPDTTWTCLVVRLGGDA